jgi:hypothetical protein
VHHYTEYMEASHFDHCLESCDEVIDSYRQMEEKLGKWGDINEDQVADAYRFRPLI